MFNALLNLTRVGLTNFRGIVVPERLCFDNTTFLEIDFSESTFHGGVRFNSCIFRGRTRFNFSVFWGDAIFTNCEFRGSSEFERCIFADQLNFHSSRFLASLDLERIEALSDVHLCCELRSTYEAESPEKLSIPTIPDLDIAESHFHDQVCLRNRILIKCGMSRAIFKKAPIFLRCTPADDMKFSSASFQEISPGAVSTYGTLINLSSSIGDWQGADMFRIRYFRSMRKDKHIPWIGKSVLALYGWTSRYGTDYTRAAITLLLVNLSRFCFALGGQKLEALAFSVDSFAEAARFTLRQIFKPFDVLTNGAAGHISIFEPAPLHLVILGVSQSLLTLSVAGIFLHTWYRSFFNKC